MQSMGLGERLLYAAPHALKNVAVVGTTGVLGAMGAYSAVRSLSTVAPLSSSSTVSRGIGQINATRQEAAQTYETSTALQDGNQTLGAFVFNAVTAPPLPMHTLETQAPDLNRWYGQQAQISPAQFLSQARRSNIINVQQYQALARDPKAQAELAESYKLQLDRIAEYDRHGDLTPQTLGQLANLRNNLQTRRISGLGSVREDTSA